MNDRYKVLAERAREWCCENAATFDTNAWQWERKFAELILEEVTILCEEVTIPFEDDDSLVVGAKVCLEMINENFGL